MPPRWQREVCASAYLDDSTAVICAETLSCSAENPTLAQAATLISGRDSAAERCVSYADEGLELQTLIVKQRDGPLEQMR